jgi:hypothetical protein
VFPGTLRVISELLPAGVFPHHPNWKMSECHIAYYELFPVVDHIMPGARGGTTQCTNLATTSTVRNSAKANFTLAELGWRLLDDGELNKWDGLTKLFFEIMKENGRLWQKTDIEGWGRAAKEAVP